MTPHRPRLAPERALPPYAFVPGRSPHPVSDPAGHSHGQTPEKPPPLDPARWGESPTYRYGFDLFNHGYYWEAHEAWESLWHAAGRRGPVATLLKGLIKLAAAGVKIRQGRADGARTHAARARELFAELRERFGMENIAGLGVNELIANAEMARALADKSLPPHNDLERIVLSFTLAPESTP